MNQTNWLMLARSLRIGQTRKTQHCGRDRSALVSNNDRGYSLYCFRCGEHLWEPHGPRSIHDILEARKGEDSLLEQQGIIPESAVGASRWPSAACLWVLKGNLSPEMAEEHYGFRYDPISRRVLIPLLGQQAFISRSVFGQRPKYTISGNGDRYALLSGRQGVMVVVEDILSAIAINRAGWPAMAILGTNVSVSHAQALAVPDLIAWFDNDAAGNLAWLRLRKRMALWPTSLRRVITSNDPKKLHRAAIVEQLEIAHD